MNNPELVENSKPNKTLTVVGTPGNKDKNLKITNEWKAKSATGSVVVDISKAKTVAEANKLIADAAGSTKFDRIYFIGHGHSELGIKLGEAWINPENEDWHSFVETIKSVTSKNAGVGFYALGLLYEATVAER